MHVEVAQGRWIRSTTRTVGIGGAWLLYSAAFTWMAFHHHERSGSAEIVSPVITAMLLFLALPGYVMGVRQLRSGVWIERTGVIVRGMFRTRRLSPDDLDGFRPGRQSSPVPLLHRKHGPPVIVGALAHGGLLQSKQADCLRALEPVCAQLNALLRTVQSERPARAPAALGMRPADHMASYRSFRSIYITMGTVIVMICVGIAALLHFDTVSLWVLGIAFVQAVGTPIVLHLARRDFERKAQAASSAAPS